MAEVKSSKQTMAYAKLKGLNFEFFVMSYPTILGRRSSSDKSTHVHLGDSKSISRRHAVIDWNRTKQMFEIKCMGKNGMAVNDVTFYAHDPAVELANRTKIQVGDTAFFFLLPLNPQRRSLVRAHTRPPGWQPGP
eukprot:c24446_g1_i1.p1 GENE.c24446_g1_i1~~c24446_g1_i1.p1  ORF type:complete len:135 (-),score=23.87 c24446_g1_i1:239-643(-)